MDYGNFYKTIDKMTVTDPAEMVQSLLFSVVEAAALAKVLGRQSNRLEFLNRSIDEKLSHVVQKLLALEGSYRHAFELCLSPWMIAVQDAAEQGVQSSFRDSEIRAMRHTFYMLLSGFVVNGQQLATYGIRDVDFAAASRRLWCSVQAYGCIKNNLDRRSVFGSRNCHRAASFKMLHDLQTRAWGQVRARVLLTIGILVPKEVCDEIFQFALAAEQIPHDPRVVMPNDRVGRTWRAGDRQSAVRPEYRCPRILQDSEARDCC